MGKINYFTDLKAWQINHQVALKIYKLTENFPSNEKYGLTDQLRRAASSVTANIAEGWGHYHFANRLRFYYNARGSNCEVQNFLILGKDLEYIDKSKYKKIVEEVFEGFRVLNGLIKSVKKLNKNK
jgi:four helix bundle protein